MFSLQELRDSGCRVDVSHVRNCRNNGVDFQITRKQWEKANPFVKWGDVVQPKGGETKVRVTNSFGDEFYVEARCNNSDVYNKKLGLKIALGRLFKKMKNS